MPSVLPFTHFTRADGGLLLSLMPCPLCEGLMRDRHLPMGNNDPNKLVRSGLVELSRAPLRKRASDEHGFLCETCASFDPTSRPTPEPKTNAERAQPPEPTLPPFVASEAVGVLESVWEALRINFSDLPEAVVVLASGTEGLHAPRFGHWAASRWRVDELDTRRAEVLVAGEALDHGPEQVLSTLLHEAAHGLAHARAVKDTSRQGRYHNMHFKLHAEELGLEVRKLDPHGWARTFLGDRTRELWADQLDLLAELCARGARPALSRKRSARPLPPQDGQRHADRTPVSSREITSGASPAAESSSTSELPDVANGVRLTLACGCPSPRRIRVVASVARLGGIRCDLCGEAFLWSRDTLIDMRMSTQRGAPSFRQELQP